MQARRASKISVTSAKRGSVPVTSIIEEQAASIGSQNKKIQVWPEWSDADVNAEKWDAAHKGKEKEKGKSPVVQHLFDDPEGKTELPPSLRVMHWKRPTDFILDKVPTVIDLEEGVAAFDLLSANEACSESELVRYIISEITALWKLHEAKVATEPGSDAFNQGITEETVHNWRPWEHIYSINKIGRGPTLPAYNSHGKYVVKLWWMGCWRKLIVDDLMPFNDDEKPLLPMTTLSHELWPMLLSKALIKVASLDYNGGSHCCEFGDFSVIHCLTGWLPETMPLQYGHLDEIWGLLQTIIPQFKLPDLPVDKLSDTEPKPESAIPEFGLGEEPVSAEQPVKDSKKAEKPEVKTAKGKDKGKDGKTDKKDKDKDKDKHKDVKVPEEIAVPDHPEMAVFASFTNVAKFPPQISALGEMADASEKLRQNNISHQYPHPVWLQQTRDCPLERPPPAEVIPPWKLIRPRKLKEIPSDEPRAPPEIPKPIQCVEISSPYINFKVSPIPIPMDTFRPPSVLERGGTRPGTSAVESIIEGDENAITPACTPVKYTTLEAIEQPKQESVEGKPQSARSTAPAAKSKARREADKPIKKEEATVVRQKKEAGSKPENTNLKKVKDRSDSAKTTKSVTDKGKIEQTMDTDLTPITPQGDDGGFSEYGGATLDEADASKQEETKPKQMWLDFDTFCKCFKTLTIYHKPYSYQYKAQHSDNMKGAVQSPHLTKSTTKGQPVLYNDEAPRFLFVDSLKPIEVIISFTSFSSWLDMPQSVQPPGISLSNPSHTNIPKLKDGKTPDKTPDKAPPTAEPASDQVSMAGDLLEKPDREKERLPVVAGTLIAEPHSWKSLAIGQPVLRLRTTATRAAVLSLPAGRHVLKFNMTAPLGYHVSLLSTTEFTFGDEEDVMPKLKMESLRYKDNAIRIVQNLCKCMQVFCDAEAFVKAWDTFEDSHCPYRFEKHMSKTQHYKLYMDALYSTVRKSLPNELLNSEITFALRALLLDATTPNILGLSPASRPATGVSTSHRGSAKKAEKGKPGREPEKVPDKWLDHEPTLEEQVAQVKISKAWRGFFVRCLFGARMPGTELNQKTHEQLLKVAAALEPQAEQVGLGILRALFKADPDLMPKYPLYKDEWNKISYNDYQGSYPDQPMNTWFIVFREIFHVTEDTLCVPKLYLSGSLNTCLLRVVDNDNGKEIPRVFQKVAPHIYKKNKKGYTFVAEARSTDSPIQGNKWKMRLIGSMNALPHPQRPEVQSSFHMKEIRDYYAPNDNNVMLRYRVKVLEDNHLLSLQLNTSKQDVYIKLQILDNGEEMVSAVGKGHVVLPSYIFHKDPATEEEKRPNSRSSARGATKGGKPTNKQLSAGHSPRTGSRASLDEEEETQDFKPHKYVIQATVLRDSWPLNQTQWAFVQELKEKEKEELRVMKSEKRDPSPGGGSTVAKELKTPQNTAKPKGKAGKDKGDKGDKKPDKTSRPPSVQFDVSKPHWTLRVVSDATAVEEIEIRKDTDRAEEIRAMKRAWEEAEPGRAAKALLSRQKYLASHMIRIDDDENHAHAMTPEPPPLEEEVYTVNPPPGPSPKEILQPLDMTPFLRKVCDSPRYKDAAEERRQMEVRQKQMQEYRMFRDRIEKWREEDRQERNKLKQFQIEECERLQAQLDEKRAEINGPREAFRQKYLEAERRRLEELAAQEATLVVPERAAPSPKGKKSGKKSPAPKGKTSAKKK